MLQEEVLLDCTLVCDGQVIRAHKAVLSSASEYFKKAFASFSSSCHSTAIIIKDMPFSDLKAIVDFIYTGDLTIEPSRLTSFIQSADSLKVHTLVSHLVTLSEVTAIAKLHQHSQHHHSHQHPLQQTATATPTTSTTPPATQKSTGSQQQTQSSPQQSNHHQQPPLQQQQQQQQQLNQKVITTAPPTCPSPQSITTSASLRNLQKILPLNQTPPPDLHSSTLAQALTASAGLSFKKEPRNDISNDDSSNSMNGEKKIHPVSHCHSTDRMNNCSIASSDGGGGGGSNSRSGWRGCGDADEMEDEERSPVDLSSTGSGVNSSTNNNHNNNNGNNMSSSNINITNSNSNNSNNGSNCGLDGKPRYPPKPRDFYANGNFLMNHHKSSCRSTESVSPPSSRSPSNFNLPFDQASSAAARVFPPSSSSPHQKALSSDDLASSLAVELHEARRDSLSSGENITLKRGRGRPPRYSIDDENWNSRFRPMQGDLDLDPRPIKIDFPGANNAISAAKRLKYSLDTSAGSLRGRKPKLDYSTSREVSGKNKCPHCPQVYYSTQAMSDHINNVHSKNMFKYTCKMCAKEFSWKISLNKHMRKQHGEETTSTLAKTSIDLPASATFRT